MEVRFIAFCLGVFGIGMTKDHRFADHLSLYLLGLVLSIGSGLFLIITGPRIGGEGPQYDSGQESPYENLRTYRFFGVCLLAGATMTLCYKFYWLK